MSDTGENVYSLGAWVRRRRKALDLTQVALAERVACAEVTIRKLEADLARPSRSIAERLAICLALAPNERTLFLQVARGERSVDQLPPPLTPLDPAVHAQVAVPSPVELLPLERVPLPAPLPSGSRMPLSRNPLFVGREQDLRQLAQVLHMGETAAIGQILIAAATGLGGIGKTQLACEFTHRYGQFFTGGVFWLSFADPAAIPAEVATCGGADGMQLRHEFGTLPLDEQVKLVLTAWESSLPRLLIFDNCEDEALLAHWRPKHGGCRVLLTSRRHHWDPALGVQPVPLDVLPRAESLRLLRQFRPDLAADDRDLQAIAEALGDLPLALHLAGSFLAHYRHAITPAQYRARLRASTLLDDRSLRAAGLSPTQHVQHVARTFEQSYTRLDPADPIDDLARKLLAYATCFAPGESLPRWLLLEALDLPDAGEERLLLVEDALTRLIDLGLLDTDAAGSLRLHRLLVAFVQAVLEDAAAQAIVEATILRVAETLNEQRNPHPLLAIQPHLRFLTEVALPQADARAAGLCTALGVHLWQLGVYAEAQRYHAQALAIRQRVLGDDHPDTARSHNYLGAVAWKQGQYAEAQRSFEQALAIRRRVLGADHADTAISLNNLGVVLENQGQYAQAQHHLEQALPIMVRVLGADHPHTAGMLHNLSFIPYYQGQYAEAQSYLERALAIRRRVLGDDHPDTAQSLNNLGDVFWSQGQYTAAQTSYEQALAIREQVLGLAHPDTAESLNSVGAVFQRQKEYTAAQASYEQALAVQAQVLGAEHPHTARTLNNLGIVLCIQAQYAEAQSYLDRALAIRQRVLGSEHPDMAESLKSIGDLLQAQGQYAEAQRAYAQALAIQERVLGETHPDTARSMRGLGEALLAHGHVTRARSCLEQALRSFTQRLGAQHPDTEQTRQALAALDRDDSGA